MKNNKKIVRDFHKLKILKGEALSTREQKIQKNVYNRKRKHKNKDYDCVIIKL